MACILRERRVGKSFLYLKTIFFVYFFVLFSESIFANPCEKVAFSKRITNSETVKIREMEFSHFRKKPRKYIVYQMDLKNRWLRFRESRPDMYNKEAYTAWLIEKQKAGDIPDKPFGYRIQERLELVAPFTYQVHHEIVPRIAPSWIRTDQLHDSKTRQEYKDWAENYYLKGNFYPPGYLQYIKNALDSHFFQEFLLASKKIVV